MHEGYSRWVQALDESPAVNISGAGDGSNSCPHVADGGSPPNVVYRLIPHRLWSGSQVVRGHACDDRPMPMENDTVDVDRFLARPLTAHVASITPEGPRVRPVWFLWEGGSFWILSGVWSALRGQIEDDARVSIVVDVADLGSGEVIQVIAIGRADVQPYDAERARRKLIRYLGDDLREYGERFDPKSMSDDTVFIRISPTSMRAKDLSIHPPPGVRPHSRT